MSLSVIAIAQPENVEMFGKIIGQDKKPISNVIVTLKGTKFETKTDSLGHYKFMIPPQLGTLIYSHPDYIIREEKFTGTPPQATDLILAAKED